MENYRARHNELTKKIDSEANIGHWEDWRWQLQNSIKKISTFEKLTGIKFSAEERVELKKTIEKFPLSITPYYLSLILV